MIVAILAGTTGILKVIGPNLIVVLASERLSIIHLLGTSWMSS